MINSSLSEENNTVVSSETWKKYLESISSSSHHQYCNDDGDPQTVMNNSPNCSFLPGATVVEQRMSYEEDDYSEVTMLESCPQTDYQYLSSSSSNIKMREKNLPGSRSKNMMRASGGALVKSGMNTDLVRKLEKEMEESKYTLEMSDGLMSCL